MADHAHGRVPFLERVGLVTDVTILNLRGDRVLNEGGATRAERLLSKLLDEVIEVIAHTRPLRAP